MKLSLLLFVFAISTEAEAAFWSAAPCPEPEADAKYSQECYKATEPPSFVCKNMKPDEWVEKALESYPRCCGDDLSECRCPVKNVYPYFQAKIDDYCAKVELCNPSSAGFSVSSGATEERFLRGGDED